MWWAGEVHCGLTGMWSHGCCCSRMCTCCCNNVSMCKWRVLLSDCIVLHKARGTKWDALCNTNDATCFVKHTSWLYFYVTVCDCIHVTVFDCKVTLVWLWLSNTLVSAGSSGTNSTSNKTSSSSAASQTAVMGCFTLLSLLLTVAALF